MRLSQNRVRELLLLTGLCGFFFFFRLNGIGLLGPDEPRYAQIAREMLARHDWITPILYGHTWLEKPILLYWGELLSYCVFGISDWAARIPSAVAATLLVFGVFLSVRRIRPTARLDAALMVASSVLVLGFARAAATDMLLAAPFALSLLAWFCWYQESQVAHIRPSVSDRRAIRWPVPVAEPLLANVGTGGDASMGNITASARLYLILFYALNAFAALAKGPVAPALAALILIAFCAAQRNPRALIRTLDPLGIAAFIAIAAPWYVLVQLHTPEFFRVFFLQHNLARFGSNLYRHKQPFWYYIPVALVATIPWTVWLFQGLADAFTALRQWPEQPLPRARLGSEVEPEGGAVALAGTASPAEPTFTFEIFLAVWAVVPIAFFSLSHSKLPGYILPSIPALLILAAVAIHRRAARDDRPHWLAICIHATLLAAIAAALCIAPRLIFKLPTSAAAMMVAAFAGTAVFLIVIIPLLTAGWPMLRFVTLLPMILAVGFLLRGLAPALDAHESSRPVAELLQQIAPAGDRAPAAGDRAPAAGDRAPAAGGPSVGPYPTAPLPLATFALNRNTALGLAFYLDRRVAPYEGLELSPAVYELPPAIPSGPHILVTREGSLPALRLLLTGRTLQFIGSFSAQRIEIYRVSSVLESKPDFSPPSATVPY